MIGISLEGKVVLITGAGHGIGQGIALKMAEAGSGVVVVVDRDADRLKNTEKLMLEIGFGGQILSVHSDVSNVEKNAILVQAVFAKYGKIDVLVNNVGISDEKKFGELTEEAMKLVYQTNVIGPTLLTQDVANRMIAQGQSLVVLFTSSIHGQVVRGHPSYSSSKAAIDMIMREIAVLVGPQGVRAISIAPGAINVEDRRRFRPNSGVPLGHFGTPVAIGELMVFLASDMGSYINGEVVNIDGGLSRVSVASLITQGKHIDWE